MLLLADAAAGGGGNALFSLLPLLLIGVFVYFAMIRPQRKRQQEFKQMQSNLAPGADVITIGGIHGRVDAIGDTYVDLEVTDDVILRFKRQAVGEVVSPSATDAATADGGPAEVTDGTDDE